MKLLYAFALVVCALGCAEGRLRWAGLRDGPYDVGTFLDGFLVEVNHQLKSKGLTAYKLNDFSVAGATGKGVILTELDTLERTGPASIANVGTIFLANVTLGLKECYLSVGSLTYSGKKAPVIFQIKGNSVQIAYSVDLVNKTNCTLSWSLFKLLKFDHVTTSSPDSSFNNSDVSELFKSTVMVALNKHFNTPEFLSFLNYYVNPCRHRTSLQDPVAQLRRLVYVYK